MVHVKICGVRSADDARACVALGANAYITKPIQAPQVITKVKELLGLEG